MSDKPINITNKIKTYLIGSMESPGGDDGGVTWRRDITPKLKARDVHVFDPTKEEEAKVGYPAEELLNKLEGWQLSGNWKLFKEHMGLIWKGRTELVADEETGEPKLIHTLGDLGYVEHSNFLIWYLEEGDQPGGTICEMMVAWYRGIPVYLVTAMPKSKINKSLLFFVLESGYGQGKVFPNFSQLLEFLDEKYNLKVKKKKEEK